MSDGTGGERASHMASLWLLKQRGFVAKTLIDVGAAEGAFFVGCQRANLYPAARYFFIDAMQENEATYRRIAEKFDAGYEIAALSCLEGEVRMRIDPDFYNTHIDHLQPATGYEASRQVPVRTLDSVVQRHALRPPFVIKLDVQGGELDVLRGGLRTLEEAIVVLAEIQIFSPRDTLVELLGFMQGMGWALYDLTDFAYYRIDASLYQCYAVFIPKSVDFRKYGVWCEPDQEKELLAGVRGRRADYLRQIDELLKGR